MHTLSQVARQIFNCISCLVTFGRSIKRMCRSAIHFHDSCDCEPHETCNRTQYSAVTMGYPESLPDHLWWQLCLLRAMTRMAAQETTINPCCSRLLSGKPCSHSLVQHLFRYVLQIASHDAHLVTCVQIRIPECLWVTQYTAWDIQAPGHTVRLCLVRKRQFAAHSQAKGQQAKSQCTQYRPAQRQSKRQQWRSGLADNWQAVDKAFQVEFLAATATLDGADIAIIFKEISQSVDAC